MAPRTIPPWADEIINGTTPSNPVVPVSTTLPPLPSPTIPSIPSTTIPAIPGPTPSGSNSTQGKSDAWLRANQQLLNTETKLRNRGIAIPEGLRSLSYQSTTVSPDVTEYLKTLGIEPKEDETKGQPWWAKAIGAGLNVLYVCKRVVQSTVNQGAQLVEGLIINPIQGEGFSAGGASGFDYWDNIADPTFGADDWLPQTGIGWIDAPMNFVVDVALDPLTYASFGIKNVVQVTAKAGLEIAVREGTEKVLKNVTDDVVKELVEKGAKNGVDKAVATKWVDDVARAADPAFIKSQTDEIARLKGLADEAELTQNVTQVLTTKVNLESATKFLDDAQKLAIDGATNIAKTLDTKGGQILIQKAAFDAAAGSYALAKQGGNKAAMSAANKVLKKETQKLVKVAGRKQSRLGYRMSGREELGQSLETARAYALKQIAKDDSIIKAAASKTRIPILGGGTKLDDASRALYEETVESITPELIRDVYSKGANALRGTGASKLLGNAENVSVTVGKKGFFIPGSGVVTGKIGKVATSLNLGRINKPLPQMFVKAFTPLGRKGLFTEDQVLKWRMGLRTGKLAPATARNYGDLLQANKNYLIKSNARRTATGSAIRNILGKMTNEDANVVSKLLEMNPLDWATLSPPPSLQQIQFAQDTRKLLDNFADEYDQAIAAAGGGQLPRLANYFPHQQSQNFIEWVRNNPQLADDIGDGFGVDRAFLVDNFVGRELKAGDVWFNTRLTPMDLKGGVTRLNEIAEKSKLLPEGVLPFETDLRKALSSYALTHARAMATMDVVKDMAIKGSDKPALFKGVDFDETSVIRPGYKQPVRMIGTKLGDVQSQIESGIENVKEAFKDLADNVKIGFVDPDIFKDILKELDYLKYRISSGSPIDYVSYQADIDDLLDYMYLVNEDILNGTAPSWLPALAKDRSDAIIAFIQNKGYNTLVELENDISKFPWTELQKTFDSGFQQLTLGRRELTDLGVKTEIANILKSSQRLTDPEFTRGVNSVLGDINNFFKSYATATPGFHFRNALSNVWVLILAGVDMNSTLKGLKYYRQYFGANRARVIRGLNPLTPEEFVRGLRVSPSERTRLIEALNSTDTSAGAFSELTTSRGKDVPISAQYKTPGLRGALQRLPGETPTGILGGTVRQGSPLQGLRTIIGLPITANKAFGSVVENSQRFILTYDGLAKGLSPTEAVSRVNKYLFDYSDLSRADKVLKNFIPFWYWSSRNFPLQFELMLTNPAPFVTYDKFRDNFGEEEQPFYMPLGIEQDGGFVLREDLPNLPEWIPLIGGLGGGSLVNPDLGFMGMGGSDNPLMTLLKLPLALTSGGSNDAITEIRKLISQTSPPIQEAFTQVAGRDPYSGRDFPDVNSSLSIDDQRLVSLLSQFFPPAALAGRFMGAAGIDPPESKFQQILLGRYPASGTGLNFEQIQEQQDLKDRRSGQSFAGLPITTYTEAQEIQEMGRRNRAQLELLAQAEAARKENR